MNKVIKTGILTCLSIIYTLAAHGQNIFKENDARFVIGIESNFDDIFSNGVVLEKPLGQFSVAASINHASVDILDFREKAQYSTESIEKIPTQDVTFSYESYEKAADFLIYSAELKYRLPCNCLFGYVRLRRAIAVSLSENLTGIIESHYDLEYDFVPLPSSNFSIVYGFGINLHVSKYFRGVFKLGNENSNRDLVESGPTKNRGRSKFLNSLSIGVQYGIR